MYQSIHPLSCANFMKKKVFLLEAKMCLRMPMKTVGNSALIPISRDLHVKCPFSQKAKKKSQYVRNKHVSYPTNFTYCLSMSSIYKGEKRKRKHCVQEFDRQTRQN